MRRPFRKAIGYERREEFLNVELVAAGEKHERPVDQIAAQKPEADEYHQSDELDRHRRRAAFFGGRGGLDHRRNAAECGPLFFAFGFFLAVRLVGGEAKFRLGFAGMFGSVFGSFANCILVGHATFHVKIAERLFGRIGFEKFVVGQFASEFGMLGRFARLDRLAFSDRFGNFMLLEKLAMLGEFPFGDGLMQFARLAADTLAGVARDEHFAMQGGLVVRRLFAMSGRFDLEIDQMVANFVGRAGNMVKRWRLCGETF